MLARITLLVLALVAIITFADWFSSPIQPCELPLQQRSETGKGYEGAKEDCSTGKVVAFWRSTGRLIDSWHDDLTAAATIVIAIFTTILGVFTVSLARSTRLAANAADLSARAAINIELPILAAEVSDFHFSTGQKQNSNGVSEHFDCCFAHYLNVANGGRTKAHLTQVEGGWHFGKELPASPNYTFTKHLNLTAILDPEAEEPMHIRISDYHFKTGPDTYDAIRSAKSNLWFFCRIAYLDFMRERREAGFCWRRYEGVGGGFFVEERAAAYNRKT